MDDGDDAENELMVPASCSRWDFLPADGHCPRAGPGREIGKRNKMSDNYGGRRSVGQRRFSVRTDGGEASPGFCQGLARTTPFLGGMQRLCLHIQYDCILAVLINGWVLIRTL